MKEIFGSNSSSNRYTNKIIIVAVIGTNIYQIINKMRRNATT